MGLRVLAKSAVVKLLLGAPPGLQRRVGGAPYVVDGLTLAPDLQIMWRAQRVGRRAPARPASVAAARAAVRASAIMTGGDQRIGAVRDLTVAGLRGRLYVPSGPRAAGAGPMLLFFHGGGFLYGDLESHDAPCRFLAEQSGVAVLSIDYRRGPEAPFPAAFDDAEASLRWLRDHAAELRVDPRRIGVAGDSAGGTLAAWVAIDAARRGEPVALQALIYPVIDAGRDDVTLHISNGFDLPADAIGGFRETYLLTPQARADERVNLLAADLPEGLAPAYVVTAGFDPLKAEGAAYAERLAAAGHQAVSRLFEDQAHGFLNIVGVGRSSRAAVAEIAAQVRTVLGQPSTLTP